MMKIKLALALVVAVSCAASTHAQTNWYVDASAPGPGTGTSTDPFPTIPAAVNNPALGDMDVIYVRPGVYGDPIVLDGPIDLRSTKGPAETILTVTDRPFIEHFQGGVISYVSSVSGFHFRGSGTQVGIDIGLSRMSVSRCVFSDLRYGVSNYSGDAFIDFCDMTRCMIGFRTQGSSISYLRRSVLWGNGENYVDGLFPVNASENLFLDPLNLGTDDFRRSALSRAIDAGSAGPGADVDPDGTPVDLGAIWYDVNHPLGETVCFNRPNSTGSMGRLRAEGTTALSALVAGAEFTLHADRCPPNVFGIFLWGTELSETPITAGALCVGGNVVRLSVVQTNAMGAAEFRVPTVLLDRLTPGDSRPMQFWHRDVSTPGVALTAAGFFHFSN